MENVRAKILTKEELLYQLNQWNLLEEKVVFTNGCFDILHSGHLKILAAAKASGDRLIVGLNTDKSVQILKGKNRPIKHENERALCLAAMYSVDAVCFFDEETPIDLIHFIRPNTIVKGGDYRSNEVIGADFVIEKGGELILVPLEEGKSSTHLIDKMNKK